MKVRLDIEMLFCVGSGENNALACWDIISYDADYTDCLGTKPLRVAMDRGARDLERFIASRYDDGDFIFESCDEVRS